MLRAMRLAGRQHAPVLGVNLGKLGFLAEVDFPICPAPCQPLTASSSRSSPGWASMARWPPRPSPRSTTWRSSASRGKGSAIVAVHVDGQPFVSYAGDAVIVATPTGSTAYSFSAGGPIVSPAVEALLVTPAAPHSAYNRGVVVSAREMVTLGILAASGRLAVEVDGVVAGYAGAGDRIDMRARPAAAQVVRLGRTTFYERARRKLRLTDSAEIPARWPDGTGAGGGGQARPGPGFPSGETADAAASHRHAKQPDPACPPGQPSRCSITYALMGRGPVQRREASSARGKGRPPSPTPHSRGGSAPGPVLTRHPADRVGQHSSQVLPRYAGQLLRIRLSQRS